ncbi:AraC family transcriptional regulator [Bradyrhizobium jicamae]|uniref:helix-turn-helix transcriptional regulator n=1 Tax=Bradyrhizobium jicamae TaxID=280332 RepID=UPI001BA51C67|nr:AraC family transcriptional regulator [Bradyrhizobium jicamae]MBR0751329.1 AraC family transcriptional regulator [Bradyrhizobium jicamae]
MRKLTVTTDDLPDHLDDRTRFNLWREAFCDWLGATDLAHLDPGPFRGRWDFAAVRDLLLVRFRGSMHSIIRTAEQVTALPQARYFLSFNLAAAEFVFSQSGRDEAIAGGRALLFSGTEPFACRGAQSWASIGIPLSMLQRLVPDIDGLTGSALDGAAPMLMHLNHYVGMLLEPGGLTDDPILTEHVEATVCDLVALALRSAGDTVAVARLRGLRGTRCGEVLRAIGQGFADPALSVQIIAAKIGVSASYVQQLLRETGVNFSERVLELRLQKARRMLADRRNDHLKVSDIALACGFNEASYFNRCFRRRYGDVPLRHRGGD